MKYGQAWLRLSKPLWCSRGTNGALLQESSKQVEESSESSKQVVEIINSMSTSKQAGESSESKISISEHLWKSCAKEADYAHFLNNFLEIYKLAGDQCKDDSDKAAFLGWSKTVKQELERHNSIVEQNLGLDPTRETTLHTTTAKYKEFLLVIASGDIQDHEPVHQSKIPAYTLGAMTPSLRLYAFLGKAVRELVTSDDTSHPRSKWIKEYSYENFKTSYLHAEVLLDKLCNSLAQEEIQDVERLYRHAMRLKMMTAQKADQLLQGQDRDKPSHITTSTVLKNTWEVLSQQSTFEYDNCIKKIMLSEKGGLDMLKVDGNAFSYTDGIFTGEVTHQAHQSVTAKLGYFEDMVQENEKFSLTLSELQLATNTIYEANLLGEGSAGSFCKAQFTDGQIFAARVVDTVALSLHEEHFFNIIQNVARLRRPNGITFTDYCLENGQLVRLDIALGIAWALDYLHSTSSPPANKNLQTANVLLDDEFMPRLCDSGLAVLRPFTGNNAHLKASDSTKDDILFFATAPEGSSISPFKYARMFPKTPPKEMPAYLPMPTTEFNAAISSSSQGSIKPKEKKWSARKWYYLCGNCRSKVAAEDDSQQHPFIQRAIILSPHPPSIGVIIFEHGPPLLFCRGCRWWLGLSLFPGPDWIVFASQLQRDYLM